MTLDPRIIYLVIMAVACAIFVIVLVKYARHKYKNEKPGPNGERRRHPVLRKVLDILPFVPIVLFGVIGGIIALDIKNGMAPPPESPAQAAYAKASTGNRLALRNMASMYESGVSVSKDIAEAYFWYSLAAAAGDEISAAKVEELAKQLEPELLESIAKRVSAWKPAP